MHDLTPINAPLTKFRRIEDELNLTLFEREEVIRACLLALLTRQHAVLIGPPGTGKSYVVTEIARRIGAGTPTPSATQVSVAEEFAPAGSPSLLEATTRQAQPSALPLPRFAVAGDAARNGDSGDAFSPAAALAHEGSPAPEGLKTFVWLITKTTQPDELFGPVSISDIKQNVFRRVTTNKLPEAEFGFLDEIFKGSSSILNTLLTIMNEREFDNGSARQKAPLISVIGASNEMPQGEDLGALWDRFTLRVIVEYLSESGFSRLMQTQAAPAHTTVISRAELAALQASVPQLPVPAGVHAALVKLRKELGGRGIVVSDRRWRWSLDLLRAQAMMEGRGIVEEDDLGVMKNVLWSEPEQRQDIGRAAARLANPVNAAAIELGDQGAAIYNAMREAITAAGADEVKKTNAAMEAQPKLKALKTQIMELKTRAEEQGRSTARIDVALAQVEKYGREVLEQLSV